MTDSDQGNGDSLLQACAGSGVPVASAESREDVALGLLIIQRRLFIGVLAVLILAFVFFVGIYFGDVLRILGISLFMAYMAINVVDWLERFLKIRAVAVIVVYCALLLLVLVSLVIIVPALAMQVTQLIQTTVDSIPAGLSKLSEMAGPYLHKLKAYQIDIKLADILQKIVDNFPAPDAGAIFLRVSDVAMGTMTWIFYGISVSVVTFYFLLEGPKLTSAVINLFPQKLRPELSEFAKETDTNLQSFFRGQIILGLAFGLLMMGVYTVLNVEYALLLGIFLGLMEILPVIGPPIGFFPAVLAVAFHGTNLPGNHFVQLLILTAIFAVLQQFKDSVVGPRYIGNVIGLHPILICLAIMIGARLDGTLGVIFALPVACILNVAAHHVGAFKRTPSEGHEEIKGSSGQDPVSDSPVGADAVSS